MDSTKDAMDGVEASSTAAAASASATSSSSSSSSSSSASSSAAAAVARMPGTPAGSDAKRAAEGLATPTAKKAKGAPSSLAGKASKGAGGKKPAKTPRTPKTPKSAAKSKKKASTPGEAKEEAPLPELEVLERPLCLKGLSDEAVCNTLGFKVDLHRDSTIREASQEDIQLRQKCASLPEEIQRRFGDVCWVKLSGYPNWPAYIMNPLTCNSQNRETWEAIPDPIKCV